MQSIKLVFGTVWCYVGNVSWDLSAAAKMVVSQMWIKDNKAKILISAVMSSFFSSCHLGFLSLCTFIK